MKFTFKNILGVFLVLVLISAGITYFSSNTTTTLSQNGYQTVKRSNLTISVTESGILMSVKNTSIKNHLEGVSTIIFITSQGTTVKKGDKIVELDASQMIAEKQKLELELENDKTAIETAKNSLLIDTSTVASETRSAKKAITFANMDLQKFQQLDKKQQLRNAETDINNAEDAFKLAEQRFNWSKKLADKGFETKSQVDRDRLDVNLKTKALETTKAKHQMLIKFDLPKQEAELKSELTEAIKKHERVVKQGESKISKAIASLASAERKFKLNQERLSDMQKRLEMATLFAPIDGLALYPEVDRRYQVSNIKEGGKVTKNTELIIIPDLSSMKVRLKVPEFHINKIAKDQIAYVTIESVQSKRLKAKITSVSAVPEKGSWYSVSSDKFYVVEVLITDPLPNVKPSVSAKTEIIVKDLKDVITLPLQAIKTEKGKHFCFVNNGGEDEKRPVTLGYISNTHAEVLSGITEGEEILLTVPL